MRRLSGWLPTSATCVLLLACVATLGAKLLAIHRLQPEHLWAAWVAVVAYDVAFFAACVAGAQIAALLLPGGWAQRLVLGAALVVLLWSLVDAAWLIYSGVQLQPGILRVIGYSPEEFWPHVRKRVMRRWRLALVAATVVGACAAWLAYRLVRPAPAAVSRSGRVRRLIGAAALAALTILFQPHVRRTCGLQFSGEVLEHNTHAYALSALVGLWSAPADEDRGRHVPRAGKREVGLPAVARADLPNIVLVLLESTSHASTSLAEGGMASTPALERLAADGAEFVRTYVPVSQTGKAYWATLTGTRPDLHYDYSEAILVDEPYENLATILKRVGYRAAFFEMSKGTFQCAPGVFANMGFDWGWWRENLEDPSAELGYLAGDDFRMLDPAFAWADEKSGPYLLMMITSVAHDPFLLPKWYGATPKSRDEAYRKAIEYTDAFVGEVLARLERRGEAERTIVCVLGDHGESLRPESKRGRWVPYEEVIRVPWLVRWPGRIAGGTRVEWPCSQMDVAPTLLHLAGFDISQSDFEGRDAMTPGDAARRLYFSSWFEDSPEGFLEGTRKTVYWPYHDKVYVFDLARDPRELTPGELEGRAREQAIADLQAWKRESHIYFSPKRFRERLLFDHWQAFTSGRSAWAYYVSQKKAEP